MVLSLTGAIIILLMGYILYRITRKDTIPFIEQETKRIDVINESEKFSDDKEMTLFVDIAANNTDPHRAIPIEINKDDTVKDLRYKLMPYINSSLFDIIIGTKALKLEDHLKIHQTEICDGMLLTVKSMTFD